MNADRKHEWINTGTRVVKLHISRILPKITDDDDDREITNLLKAMSVLSTGGPSSVNITEVLKPHNPRGWSSKFKEARANEMNRL